MKDPLASLLELEICDRGRRRARFDRAGTAPAGGVRGVRAQAEDGFTCRRCGAFVSAAIALAGVVNRNHCPYCLWSRHLDLERAGDRLSACKALMRPVGLTLKRTPKKYRTGTGELMLVHRCTECERLSINRLAADDDPDTVLAVFEASSRENILDGAIQMIGATDRELVRRQLFGRG